MIAVVTVAIYRAICIVTSLWTLITVVQIWKLGSYFKAVWSCK